MQRLIPVLVLLVSFFAATAQAGEATKEELKKRFKERFIALEHLKESGKVGENREGYVEAVKDEYLKDEKVKKIVTAENADRKALYKIIAKESGLSAKDVAVQNAVRIYKRAEPGEYLKDAKGNWYQKK